MRAQSFASGPRSTWAHAASQALQQMPLRPRPVPSLASIASALRRQARPAWTTSASLRPTWPAALSGAAGPRACSCACGVAFTWHGTLHFRFHSCRRFLLVAFFQTTLKFILHLCSPALCVRLYGFNLSSFFQFQDKFHQLAGFVFVKASID
jgi:hypothetical protein